MEMKRYKNIVFILLIILLFSSFYSMIIIQPPSDSWAASISSEVSMEDSIELQRNAVQNSSSKNSEFDRMKLLSEIQKHRPEEDYQQLIIEKNIFNLTNKKKQEEIIAPESQETAQAKEIKEDTLNRQKGQSKKDKPTDEMKNFQVPNPFYLLGTSINSFDKMAVIVNYNTSMTYLIKPGDIIDNYLVKTVDYRQVIMEKNAQEIVVVFQN